MSFSLHRTRAALAGTALLLAPGCGSSGSPGPSASSPPAVEFKVAQPSDLTEGEPLVAPAPGGGFAVGWVTNNRVNGPNDSVLFGFRARRFDAAARARGEELVIQPESAAAHPGLRLVYDTRGGLVAAWEQKDGIFGRRYDASGAAVGAPFPLRPGAVDDIFGLEGLSLTDGGASLLLVWREYAQQEVLYLRRFTLDGAPVSEPVPLVPPGGSQLVTVWPRGSGTLTMVWLDAASGFQSQDLKGRPITDRGAAAGPVFALGQPERTGSDIMAVQALADGGTVLVWKNHPVGGRVVTPVHLLLQRFDANGAAVAGTVRLLPAAGDAVFTASVSGGRDGLVVAWTQDDAAGAGAPMAQRFEADGTPQGSPLSLATQARPAGEIAVGADDAGAFVAAWTHAATNASRSEVWARFLKNGGM